MKKTALLTIILVSVAYPALAKSHHAYRHKAHHAYQQGSNERHPHVSCEMVRAYVSQVGLTQAKAMAQSAGMTASEQRRAMRCLEKNI
jgi:hypothetical protein